MKTRSISADTIYQNVEISDVVDSYLSAEECEEYLVKMCADQQERVVLPWPDKSELPHELTLAEFVVIQNDPEFKEKFELYQRKDKLKDLLEEYIRKKGTEHFSKQLQQASFWVKFERGEALLDNLDSAYDVFKDVYCRFVGFQDNVHESETNANFLLQAEVIFRKTDFRRCQRNGITT